MHMVYLATIICLDCVLKISTILQNYNRVFVLLVKVTETMESSATVISVVEILFKMLQPFSSLVWDQFMKGYKLFKL